MSRCITSGLQAILDSQPNSNDVIYPTQFYNNVEDLRGGIIACLDPERTTELVENVGRIAEIIHELILEILALCKGERNEQYVQWFNRNGTHVLNRMTRIVIAITEMYQNDGRLAQMTRESMRHSLAQIWPSDPAASHLLTPPTAASS